ncbi:hypothetical protein SEA_ROSAASANTEWAA_55 [Streptomyces phage RosaAsantewaa]|nr:hypothetical protein SEA_ROSAASANTEWAA_55 [Streptomyces phage RosaAsantewaa]
MTEHMLTTVDNPFNPFTEWDQWDLWDRRAGYHTTSYLARVVRTSDELSDADQSLAIEHAIDEIVSENLIGVYKKVTAASWQPLANQPTPS